MNFRLWENHGINVLTSSEDLCDSKYISSILDESNHMGPVEGVYVIAANVTEQNYDKLNGIISTLDRATRKLCPSIRFASNI